MAADLLSNSRLSSHLNLAVNEGHLSRSNPAVVMLIENARSEARSIYLASTAEVRYAKVLVYHLGNDQNDLGADLGANPQLWERGGTANFATGSVTLASSPRNLDPEAIVRDHQPANYKPYFKALRPHQWVKNILIFAPAAAGHMLIAHLAQLVVAFVAFGLCASSVYITNDLLDLQGDRDHAQKRHRPFASGAVPVSHGLMMAAGLLITAFALALLAPPMFALALLAYYLLTTAYSLCLKRQPIIDVIVLACLYGMRLVAGGCASGTEISPWLYALAIFLFLSLALVKRCAEIVQRIASGKGELIGRGYRLNDLPMLEVMAAAAGYNAALVLALYINFAPEGFLYVHPHRLLLLCIVLLTWISRILLLTRRGEMYDDPVIYAVHDRWSLMMGAMCGLVVMAAGI